MARIPEADIERLKNEVSLVRLIDALGYLTIKAYDAEGNLATHVEYAHAATNVTASGYTAPPASADDRITTYGYDGANRRTSQTQVNVQLSTNAGGGAQASNLTTLYGYDAAGNRTTVTDAYGVVTTTAYDALGRAILVTQPVRAADNGAAVAPATAYLRDAYGNVVVQIDYANGTAGASAADHVALTRYDRRGDIVQAQDSAGHDSYTSYDAGGRVAKQWQTLTASNGGTYSQVEAYRYDRVGNVVDDLKVAPASTLIDAVVTDGDVLGLAWRGLVNAGGGNVQVQVDYTVQRADGTQYTTTTTTSVAAASAANGTSVNLESRLADGKTLAGVTAIRVLQADAAGTLQPLWQSDPGYALGTYVVTSTPTALSDSHYTSDAFGDVTGRQVDGGLQEYWNYDAAGRMWQTNEDDGVAKVTLYDTQGDVTSQMTSATTDLGAVTSAAQAMSATGVVRLDSVRDALGNTLTETQTLADGSQRVATQTVDRWGNVLQLNDQIDGTAGQFAYNALNEKIEEYLPDAAGNLTLVNGYVYDLDGRLAGSRDQAGVTTTRTYDADGNVVATAKSDGTSGTYRYDGFGNRTGATDQAGQAVTSTYDANDRLVQTATAAGTQSQITYDELGRPQRAEVTVLPQDAGQDWATVAADIQKQLDSLKTTIAKNPFATADSKSQPSREDHGNDVIFGNLPQMTDDQPTVTGGLDESGDDGSVGGVGGSGGASGAGSAGSPQFDFPDMPSVGDESFDDLVQSSGNIDLANLPETSGAGSEGDVMTSNFPDTFDAGINPASNDAFENTIGNTSSASLEAPDAWQAFDAIGADIANGPQYAFNDPLDAYADPLGTDNVTYVSYSVGSSDSDTQTSTGYVTDNGIKVLETGEVGQEIGIHATGGPSSSSSIDEMLSGMNSTAENAEGAIEQWADDFTRGFQEPSLGVMGSLASGGEQAGQAVGSIVDFVEGAVGVSAGEQAVTDWKEGNYGTAVIHGLQAIGQAGLTVLTVIGGAVEGAMVEGAEEGAAGIGSSAADIGVSESGPGYTASGGAGAAGGAVDLISARQQTANDYYKSLGWEDARIASHTSGIDFSQPVDVITLSKGTQVVQYQIPGSPTGRYFAPVGTAAESIGISSAGRDPIIYVTTENVPVLRSTAADTSRNLSLPENARGAGGGTQFFTTDPSVFHPFGH